MDLWVITLFISSLNFFIHILEIYLKLWLASQPKKILYYLMFWTQNCFEIYQNSWFIKWYFYHYLGIWGVIEKEYQSIVFKPWNATPTKTKMWFKTCIIVINSWCDQSKAKKTFLEKKFLWEVTTQWSMQLKLVSAFFEVLYIGNSLIRHGELPTSMTS